MVEGSKQSMYLAIVAIVIAVLAIGLTFTTQAPQGLTGPEGPQGVPGEDGAVGPAGPPGEGIETSASLPGTIEGKVLSAMGDPVPNASVEVEGQAVSATTDASGVFKLEDVEPGFAYVYVNAPSDDYLDGETHESVYVSADATTSGVEVTLSGRPSDEAEYTGMDTCVICHES